MNISEQIDKGYRFLQTQLVSAKPKIGLILGSGFSEVADHVQVLSTTPFDHIPGFPKASVEGHEGLWIVARLDGVDLVIMKGRIHYYEGHSMQTLSLPVRIMSKLSIETMILTNASGAINSDLSPGDLMLIKDHINLSFTNPLIGPNDPELGPRFPDTSTTYTLKLRQQATHVANQLQIPIIEGVYLFTSGPSYETPAEVRMMRTLGADVVGMSTVPEALAAKHAGMKVLGISQVTNMAAGLSSSPLSHEDVLKTTAGTSSNTTSFVLGCIKSLAES